MRKPARTIEQLTLDIEEFIYNLKDVTSEFSEEEIYEDKFKQAFLERQIEKIGEAVSKIDKLDKDILCKAFDNKSYWENVKSTRHIIVHDYFEIRTDILYEIAKKDLNKLLEKILIVRKLSK